MSGLSLLLDATDGAVAGVVNLFQSIPILGLHQGGDFIIHTVVETVHGEVVLMNTGYLILGIAEVVLVEARPSPALDVVCIDVFSTRALRLYRGKSLSCWKVRPW